MSNPMLIQLDDLSRRCTDRRDGYKVLVISGPGGVGKGAAIDVLLQKYDPHLFFSVSCTTRRPRNGEKHEVHYHFVGREEFQRRRDNKGFLECNEVHGEWYGTPAEPIYSALQNGKFAILEIDVEGAGRVREAMPEACFAFLHAPRETLEERLRSRSAISLEQRTSLERRLERLPRELEAAKAVFEPHEWLESVPGATAEDSIKKTAESLILHLEAHAAKRWRQGAMQAEA